VSNDRVLVRMRLRDEIVISGLEEIGDRRLLESGPSHPGTQCLHARLVVRCGTQMERGGLRPYPVGQFIAASQDLVEDFLNGENPPRA